MAKQESDRARIEAALREASEYVARMPASAGERELRSRIETFQRVVAAWGRISRPTPEQIEALIERVTEVRQLATSSAPTVRRKSKAPSSRGRGP
jgi:hypothetical protein